MWSLLLADDCVRVDDARQSPYIIRLNILKHTSVLCVGIWRTWRLSFGECDPSEIIHIDTIGNSLIL